MVHDGADVPEGPANLDSVQVRFDEQRLISNAGLLVTATLAERLGIEQLVNESVWLDPSAPGAALPGRKVLSLVHGMLAGADSIDDMNVLRAGSTGLILGHRVMAPSTLGTFLRAFTFGHVRQLDHVLDQALCRAWQAGAGPGRAGHTGLIIIRADSGFENHKLFEELNKRGIEFSIGVKLIKTIRTLIEQIAETDSVTVADYPDGGEAQVAETQLKGFRLIVRRTRLIGAQAELFPDWRYHCFATNRTIPTMVADIDHRDHATFELAIRDLIDQALQHFPSGRMHANSAWTVITALAHNLGRWTTQIGQPNQPVQTARSRRHQLLHVPARLTRTSRQWTLPMPARWPWQHDFTTILDAIRALPALT